MKRKRLIRILIGTLILIIIVWAVILYQIFEIKSKEGYYGTWYERSAPDFNLTSQDGRQVSLSDFKGEAVLLFFGYTHCPDICPLTMSTMDKVIDNLGESADRVQVLFITVDPERDSPGRLMSYIPYYNESFIGLTGSPEQIKSVADEYNVFYAVEESESESGYLMGHNSSVLLISPAGEIVLRYTQNKMDPELIAKDIERIL